MALEFAGWSYFSLSAVIISGFPIKIIKDPIKARVYKFSIATFDHQRVFRANSLVGVDGCRAPEARNWSQRRTQAVAVWSCSENWGNGARAGPVFVVSENYFYDLLWFYYNNVCMNITYSIHFGNHIETQPQLLSFVVKPMLLQLALAPQLSTLVQVRRLWLPRHSRETGSWAFAEHWAAATLCQKDSKGQVAFFRSCDMCNNIV